ncbi:electron transport complex subunit RsxE [Pseudomarimonas salicorniae]|uniref:Electron transport complex subunit E n=1 Tax=Pseudomarimonas salicorniae TaxID=2933270 RepID=A0ABT0GL51_9GAMM|nr:electron transport complex subunit E [Lysobacter sp. CAU 1642]MCK7595264.1 electron transport complex subunit E [Lysobacter sp. CAU 1642]
MDPSPSPAQIAEQGLWRNNVGLVQLLGLCPLLAVSHNAVNALALGLATLIALTATALGVSALRHLLSRPIRLPGFLLLIASIVTAIELLIHAFLPALHEVLGLFLPLIVTNCALLGRAEAFSSRQPVASAALDGLFMGLGFLAVLLALGMLRELLGQGSLFAGAGRLLHLPFIELRIGSGGGLLLASLPTGAFLSLALLVALKQWRDLRAAPRQASPSTEDPRLERPAAP